MLDSFDKLLTLYISEKELMMIDFIMVVKVVTVKTKTLTRKTLQVRNLSQFLHTKKKKKKPEPIFYNYMNTNYC